MTHRGRYGHRHPIEPVLHHIDRILAEGGTVGGIADRAGVGLRTVVALRSGRRKWCHSDTAARILATEEAYTDDIPVTGTARRLRALNAIGWSFAHLGERLGWSVQYVSGLCCERRPMVTRRNAARVAALYDALSMTPGPSRSAALRARRKGWMPPLAWADDDIDDPAAWADCGGDDADIVDPVVVDRLLAGRLDWRDATRAERLEAGRIALTRDGGHAFCAEVLGLRHDAIRQLRQEVAA